MLNVMMGTSIGMMSILVSLLA